MQGIYRGAHIHADINGWIKYGMYHPNDFGFDNDDVDRVGDGYLWRHKSLQGIENNNDWISINSESDLPSDLEVCHFIPRGFFDEQFTGFIKDDEVYFVDRNIRVNKDEEQDLIYLNSWLKCQITHYQPINKPQPPLHK